MVARCSICKSYHYNACPVLWGGSPERPSVEEIRKAEKSLRDKK